MPFGHHATRGNSYFSDMKHFPYGLFLLAGLSLAGCQSNHHHTSSKSAPDSSTLTATKPAPVAELEKKVLAVHDSVMPAMSDLIRLKKEVTEHLAELDKQPASDAIRRQQEKGLAIKQALIQADQTMMDWMHTYNGDTLNVLDEAHALTYLNDQQQRVNTMRLQLQKSITDAQAYLKSL